MTPTAVALVLAALLIAGVAFGAVLLNVPPLVTAALVVAGCLLALGVASRARRR